MDRRNRGRYNHSGLRPQRGRFDAHRGSHHSHVQPPSQTNPQNHQSLHPLSAPFYDQSSNDPHRDQPVHSSTNNTLNRMARNFITQSPEQQGSTRTASGETTPRALSWASTIHQAGEQQQHEHIGLLHTCEQLGRQITDIVVVQPTNPCIRHNALTILKTQVLGFVMAKGNEKAAINTELERERLGMGQNSYETLVALEKKEEHRQAFFDCYGRKYLELEELIEQAHEDIQFGTAADPWPGS